MSFKSNYYGSAEHLQDIKLRESIISLDKSNKEVHRKMLTEIKSNLNRSFQEHTNSLVEAERESARVVAMEIRDLQNRIDEDLSNLSGSVLSASSNIVYSINKTASYLGKQLSEISFQLSQLTEISLKALEVMLESLSNESRQYFEQGKRCFAARELSMAQERFEKALLSDSTNWIVHLYLAFIATEQDEQEAAFRHFELAVKFSPEGTPGATSRLYLARAFLAVGKIADARTVLIEAVEQDKTSSQCWYELASCWAKEKADSPCVVSLERAVRLDWNYWVFVAIDKDFDPVVDSVNKALKSIKENQRQRAITLIECAKMMIDTASKLGIDTNHANSSSEMTDLLGQKLESYENSAKSSNIFRIVSLIENLSADLTSAQKEISSNAMREIEHIKWQKEKLNKEHESTINRLRYDAEREKNELEIAHKKAIEKLASRHEDGGLLRFMNDGSEKEVSFTFNSALLICIAIWVWIETMILRTDFADRHSKIWIFTITSVVLAIILFFGFVIFYIIINPAVRALIKPLVDKERMKSESRLSNSKAAVDNAASEEMGLTKVAHDKRIMKLDSQIKRIETLIIAFSENFDKCSTN